MENRLACILLVDDEDMVLDIGKMMLERLGYQVLSAKNSVEAVEIYKNSQNRIDVVLLDINLPDESGAETFKKIGEIDPGARIILATGHGETQEVLELIGLGCLGMIQKPYTLDALAAKINLALT